MGENDYDLSKKENKKTRTYRKPVILRWNISEWLSVRIKKGIRKIRRLILANQKDKLKQLKSIKNRYASDRSMICFYSLRWKTLFPSPLCCTLEVPSTSYNSSWESKDLTSKSPFIKNKECKRIYI